MWTKAHFHSLSSFSAGTDKILNMNPEPAAIEEGKGLFLSGYQRNEKGKNLNITQSCSKSKE